MKKTLKKQRGITLIALVVTIIILIILATISINVALGENGLIASANRGKLEHRAATVQEEVMEWKVMKKIAEYDENTQVLSRHDFIKDQWERGLLTDDERQDAEDDGTVQIGSQTINYGDDEPTAEQGDWTYDQATQTVTNAKTNQTLNIGDYVDYKHAQVAEDATTEYTSEEAQNGYRSQKFELTAYTGKWRVLGADEQGRLVITTDGFIQPTEGGYSSGGFSFYRLGIPAESLVSPEAKKNVYVNGIEELKKICSMFGEGPGAESATTITVDDINTITGYDAETAGYSDGSTSPDQYGNKVTYTLKSNKIYYQGTKYPTTEASSNYSKFEYYDADEKTWKSLTNEGDSKEITSDYYKYYPDTLTSSSSSSTTPGISKTSEAYKMLFTHSTTSGVGTVGSTSYMYYWLGSSYIRSLPRLCILWRPRCAWGLRVR